MGEASIVRLPSELIQHVLSFLDLLDLVSIAKTCHRLRRESYDDQVWSRIVNDHLVKPIIAPAPFTSFRSLYIAHHPRWFVVKHRIWFADTAPNGKLLLARYNERTGSIEAYTVTAIRGRYGSIPWEKSAEVTIHSFNPQISLDLHKPVIYLVANGLKHHVLSGDRPASRVDSPAPDFSQEILMEPLTDSSLHSSFMLCRALPTTAISSGTQVWPPLRFPSTCRTRSESSGHFRSTGHQPTKLSEISSSNFRLRKWVNGRRSAPQFFALSPFHGLSALTDGRIYSPADFSRLPQEVTTFATLPASCYAPSAHKPWQGIWCGDYSAHGCEFFLITQPDREDEAPLPQGMDRLQGWFGLGRDRSESESSSTSSEYLSATEESTPFPDQTPKPGPSSSHSAAEHAVAPSGRLEAIKLTGDPNIPRGEYTFIAPDIGPQGFIRTADEEIFRGARVVRSCSHIANHGFQQEQYTPSELIMISPDLLAQYWEEFKFISFYQRMDLDKLVQKAADDRAN